MKKQITGFVWVFPPQSALSGQKCVLFHDFQNHNDYAACLNQVFEMDIQIKGQVDSEGCYMTSGPCRIMNFGKWFSSQRELYGICIPTTLAGVSQITDFVTIELGPVR